MPHAKRSGGPCLSEFRTIECCGEYWVGPVCRKCGRQLSAIVWDEPSSPAAAKPPRKKAPRGQKLTKAEERVLAHLLNQDPDRKVIPHGIRLAFEDGTTYTPDLVVYEYEPCRFRLVEVKGGYRGPGWEQGYERFRRARDVFSRWFEFELIDVKEDGIP